ncbi:MAG: alpha-L-fucosidase, partial [Sedimentisphaerales bacterium]|nr:alpha-L-fucosidase [Sedimentisphaerales bacterium]
LLLNVCPKADGTITDGQQQLLREMGQWLKVNGEAIYATRPWLIYGQGPTRMTKGGGFLDTIHYTPQDVRFTRSKDGKTLYAICLGWPDGDFTLDSMTVQNASGARVSLLGSDAEVSYTVNLDKSVTIHTPKLGDSQRPCKYAYSFKLDGFDMTANPFATSQAIVLKAEQATLEGEKIALEERNNQTNIGFWDNPKDAVHWLVRIPAEGNYLVRGRFAAASGASQLLLTAQENQLKMSIPASGSWDKPVTVDAGKLTFEKPGIYHLILAAADGSAWKAVNVWDIQLAPANP